MSLLLPLSHIEPILRTSAWIISESTSHSISSLSRAPYLSLNPKQSALHKHTLLIELLNSNVWYNYQFSTKNIYYWYNKKNQQKLFKILILFYYQEAWLLISEWHYTICYLSKMYRHKSIKMHSVIVKIESLSWKINHSSSSLWNHYEYIGFKASLTVHLEYDYYSSLTSY